MRRMLLANLTPAMLFALLGCQADFTPVTVRFVMSPDATFVANQAIECEEPEVLQASFDDAFDNEADSDWSLASSDNRQAPRPNAYHVALWGGKYDGRNVTYTPASLKPGNYTFVSMDRNQDAAIQGWVTVNATGGGLIDTLKKWQNDIPQRKDMLAYGFGLKRWLNTHKQDDFAGFNKQIRAFNRLDRQIERAIIRESATRDRSIERDREFLASAEVLLLPLGRRVSYPTTRPAFGTRELASVRSGDALTKVLILSDREDNQQKVRIVNGLRRELTVCRNVLNEEIDRFAQHKRIFTATDHIYHNDDRIVQNEMRQQQAIAAVECINEQLAELRSRSMALAFVNELISSEGSFQAVADETEILEQERRILTSKKDHIDSLLSDVDEQSPRRSLLQNQQQRYSRSIAQIDRQVEELSDARVALRSLTDSSEVIHRVGQAQMVSTVVGPDVPFNVQEAISREALMTVRLERVERLFVPTDPSEARARTAAAFSAAPRQ